MSVQMSATQIEEFDASVFMSEQLNRSLINMSQGFAIRCIEACAKRYNFDSEDACRYLNLSMIKVVQQRKTSSKKTTTTSKVAPKPKASFPLPYNGELNDTCCYALRLNNGLYTQCTYVPKDETEFCKGCTTAMAKIGSEVPQYGTIQQRNAVGIFEYVDPNERKPVAYTKVMKKYKISKEQVLEEAEKLNINIDPDHFNAPEETKRGRPKVANKEVKPKGVKGRPKKDKTVVAVHGEDNDDLFAVLVAKVNSDVAKVNSDISEDEDEDTIILEDAVPVPFDIFEDEVSNEVSDEVSDEGSDDGSGEGSQAEAFEVAPKKKTDKSDEKNEAKRIADLAKKEKKDKLDAEKAQKELKKAEKDKAKAEKDKAKAEKDKAKAEKDKAKAEKENAEKAVNKSNKKEPEPELEEEDEKEVDVVRKLTFNNKTYFKSKKSGVIYDYDELLNNNEQVIIGQWNETSKEIDFNNDEEEEDEYDM